MHEASENLRRIGEVADTNPETLPSTTPRTFRFRYIDLSSVESGFINWAAVSEVAYGAAPSRARRVVRPLDVLFGTVRPNLRSHGFIYVESQDPLVASTGFSIIRAKDGVSYPAYLFHALMSRGVGAQAERDAVGSSYPAVNDADVRQFQIFVPTYSEQVKVAQILDTLDTVIHETEAIIAKLNAVKQGLLHDLLTRGIDANGELRPLRTEAPQLYKKSPLGWIPKDWEVERLSDACSAIVDCPHSTPHFQDEGVLVARTMHIKDGTFQQSSASRVSEREYFERIARLTPVPGDLIFTREAPVGEAFVIPNGMQVCLGQRVMLLRPKPGKLIAEFLLAQIYSGAVKDRIATLTSGTTNPHLNVSEVKDFEIPLPSLEEQQRIAERVSSLEDRIQYEMQEREKWVASKAGLMDDLLSGRVGVTPLLGRAEGAT